MKFEMLNLCKGVDKLKIVANLIYISILMLIKTGGKNG